MGGSKAGRLRMNDVAEVERLFAKGWHTPHDEPSYANFSAIEPLAKLSMQGNFWAGISNFRIGLSRPTLKEVIPTVCSLPFPVS